MTWSSTPVIDVCVSGDLEMAAQTQAAMPEDGS